MLAATTLATALSGGPVEPTQTEHLASTTGSAAATLIERRISLVDPDCDDLAPEERFLADLFEEQLAKLDPQAADELIDATLAATAKLRAGT
jgi:hypothetical protein